MNQLTSLFLAGLSTISSYTHQPKNISEVINGSVTHLVTDLDGDSFVDVAVLQKNGSVEVFLSDEQRNFTSIGSPLILASPNLESVTLSTEKKPGSLDLIVNYNTLSGTSMSESIPIKPRNTFSFDDNIPIKDVEESSYALASGELYGGEHQLFFFGQDTQYGQILRPFENNQKNQNNFHAGSAVYVPYSREELKTFTLNQLIEIYFKQLD